MIYAPILIPTLNRINHLQRCIASLQKNAWAQFTPLIISVDYPPESRYYEGYRKVCEYLKEGIDGFASVDIIYQKDNLGLVANYQFLKDYSKERYDRYIYAEDDIEMSPNFIEYIDKGLEIFQYDDRVIAVCSSEAVGCCENDDGNVVLSHNFSAHGYGGWHTKDKEILGKNITRKCFLNIAGKSKNIFKLYKYDYELVFALQHAIYRDMNLYQLPDGEIPIIDMTIKIYTVLNDKYVVCPKLQKSRNWGYDGSGVNCLLNEKNNPNAVAIDQRIEFTYCYTEPMEKNSISRKRNMEIELRILIAFLKLKMWLLFIKN